MSRPAPNPKANFLQTALIMMVVYLGFMIIVRPGQQQQQQKNTAKPVTRADYLQQLHLDDSQGKDVTGRATLNEYNGVIDDDVKRKLISPQDGLAEKIEAATINANTMLVGGLRLNESARIRNAYNLLEPYFRKNQDNPGWTTPVLVYKTPTQQVTTNARDLLDNIIDTLSQRNQKDLVWGVIPGGYKFIDVLVHMTGAAPDFSYAFAAFLLALVVRAIVFPLSQKQLMFSRQMSQLTPRISEIKKQYENDSTEVSRRTMELYKEYGINPAAGCLPAFVQMPLFWTVYQCMVLYQFTFSKGHFLWINPATSATSHGFIAPNLGQQDTILIAIYGVTMLTSTLLTPVTDPTQLKQQRLMGVGVAIMVTAFMFIGYFPVVSGFVLYWTFTNIFATAQAFRAYRLPLPPLVKVNTANGGVYPSKGPQGLWMKLMEDAQKMQEQKKHEEGKNGESTPKQFPPNNGSPSKNGGDTKPKGDSNGKKKDGGSTKANSGSDQTDKGPKHKPKKRE